jgi:mono/diheme cytochrome c family protein
MRTATALAAALVSGLASVALPAAATERSPRVNYILRCAGCHGIQGAGTVKGGVPSFHGSVSDLANDDAGRTYVLNVPGVLGSSLTDSEIAAVMTYVVDRWGGEPAPAFSPEEVARRQATPVADIVAMRRALAARFAAEGRPLPEYPWP